MRLSASVVLGFFRQTVSPQCLRSIPPWCRLPYPGENSELEPRHQGSFRLTVFQLVGVEHFNFILSHLRFPFGWFGHPIVCFERAERSAGHAPREPGEQKQQAGGSRARFSPDDRPARSPYNRRAPDRRHVRPISISDGLSDLIRPHPLAALEDGKDHGLGRWQIYRLRS